MKKLHFFASANCKGASSTNTTTEVTTGKNCIFNLNDIALRIAAKPSDGKKVLELSHVQ